MPDRTELKDEQKSDELLILLRKQEARAKVKKEEADHIRKLAGYVAMSAFLPIIFILIANGNTPDTTGNWLPGTGKYVIASGGLLVVAFIINLVAKAREP